ncbi:MAG: PAC2 family protein [Candidatus Bathyarchaeota archaeon]|nr:PAC2 family protein [Candidatus Bathyarchaeum tardum]WGM88456.1 MAG: PAC2 family protein [Candidatus Bathyarchaeum tardum]WNZ29273.1 MAG: PAC2 family protein [Candidatus Bathyarchaeota archaeon]
MVCKIQFYEKPVLNNPVLIEGLPGIGFVANVTTLHLIKQLNAKLFAQVQSSSFQDLAMTTRNGKTYFPTNQFYYYKGKEGERDLILLYGNTQALTTVGQYELCGKILDICQEFGCKYVLTVGGLKKDEAVETPDIYCTASDKETLQEVLDLGAKIMKGHIFGVAGLLVGLCKLRNFKGLSLLAETPGLYADAVATREVLKMLNTLLNLKVNVDDLDAATEETSEILESFGIVSPSSMEKKNREADYRWFI